MRQTLLNYRNPTEHTPEFRLVNLTYKGDSLKYKDRDTSDPNVLYNENDISPKKQI